MNYRSFARFVLFAICIAAAGACCARASADKPNLDLFVYRRAYTPDETLSLRLSAYNIKSVDFAAYSIDLRSLTPNSKSLEHLKGIIAAVDLARLRPARSWRFKIRDAYPDQWCENEVKAPVLKPGVYLIRARSGRIEKRTWLAVTDMALVTKRSRQELIVYAVDARTGQPRPATHLGLIGANGAIGQGVTDASGIWRSRQSAEGNLWLIGMRGAMPAFLLTGAPAAPDPYAVHISTDRPIYRPGNRVMYRSTVRERLESDAPGGFTLRPYAGRAATIEIRDSTDALIARQQVTTNRFGSYESSVQLASEPPLGRWQIVVVIGKFRAYSAFEVEEYRKPEFTVAVKFPAAHLQGGAKAAATIEARYFFGQPVADAAVNYRISFTPEDAAGQGGGTEPPFEGQGVTGPDGRLSLDIPTKRLPANRRLAVAATVTDLSRRTQQGGGSMLITAGQFHVTVETDRYMVRVNQPVLVTVTAIDYDQRPVSARVQVRLVETKLDSMHRPVKQITSHTVVTDAAGKGAVSFTPQRPGDLLIEAEAFDTDNDRIMATGQIWVAGNEDADVDYPTLNLIADRDAFRPGDTANILINTSLITQHMPSMQRSSRRKNAYSPRPAGSPGREQGYALVTVEGERIYSIRTIPLHSRSTSIAVPLKEAYFPSVQISVLIVMDKHIYEQEARLPVERDQNRLQVTVMPSRERFTPGEDETYTVTTRDYRGNPASAEVALNVVDASIYALQPDDTPDLFSTFYSGQEVRVETDFSFAAQYSGGGVQTMPHQPPDAWYGRGNGRVPAIRVRRQFADTAYWNPSVVTDAGGTATVSFTLPDNLTTWRATARGITLDTSVGMAKSDAVSTMPLTVRFELPRFYVAGDKATVSAIVHNGTDGPRTVQTDIEATGAHLDGAAQQTVSLEAGKEARLDWTATLDPGEGAARFHVTADGGLGARDATELTLPRHEDGLQVVEATADTISEADGSSRLDLTDLPANASVNVSLAPSVAGAIFEALDYLQTYPYGCAEQTMSSFLPDIVVAGAFRALHTNLSPRPDLNSWVGLGMQKLYRYQHIDGGWNWWENDQTDGEMTAYVLWGFVQAREAGYLVDEQRLNRGAEALLKLLKTEKELNARADWLLTLAYVRPKETISPLLDAYAHRSLLDTYALASLGLALTKMSGINTLPNGVAPRFGQLAKSVAGELEARAVKLGTSVHWPAAVGGYTWREGDVSVTAHVLRAVLGADSRSSLVPGAVRWLMGDRKDKAWESTRSSAEAVFALAQVMEKTRELQPDYHVTVSIDGTAIKELDFHTAGFNAPEQVTLTPALLVGHRELEITKHGAGVLYAAIKRTYTVPSAAAMPLSRGLTIHRTYRIAAEDPVKANSISSGQDFDVQTEITADANYKYAVVEDPIPAGCEVDSADVAARGGIFMRREVRDNRVVFFFDDLPKGKTEVTYRLHAETPGLYRVLPSIGSLAYFPEIRGNSAPVSAKIIEK